MAYFGAYINGLQKPSSPRPRIWLAISALLVLVVLTAVPASADGPIRAEGALTETTGGGPIVMDLDVAKRSVTGSLEYSGQTTCTFATGEVILVTMYADLAIKGTLNDGNFSGTLTGSSSTDNPNCSGRPMSLTISGVFDFKAGRGFGLIGGDSRSKWQVEFVVPQADFSYEPQKPKQGDKIVFTDASIDPKGGVLTPTWYVDGVKQGATGAQFTWQLPDSKAHNVKLVVTNAQGTTAEVEKTIEPQLFQGQVVAVSQAGETALPNVAVHVRLPDGKNAKATTDKDGNFELALPAVTSGAATVEFTGLDLPAGGATPWLIRNAYYPLQKTHTLNPAKSEKVKLEVTVGTLALHIVLESPPGAPANAVMPAKVVAQAPPGEKARVFQGAMSTDDQTIVMPVLTAGPGGSTIRPEGDKAFDLNSMPLELLANFDSVVTRTYFELSGPAGVQRREYELTLPNPAAVEASIRSRVRTAIMEALSGRADAQNIADTIANTPVQPNASVQQPQYEEGQRVIRIPGEMAEIMNNPSGRETFAHELFHALQAQVLRDSRSLSVGGDHEFDKPSNPDLAFDEGRGHFFGYLMQAMAKKEGQNPPGQTAAPRLIPTEKVPVYDAGALGALPKQYNTDGSRIEAVVAGFLLDFYGQEAKQNPQKVFKDFYGTSEEFRKKHGNPPSTVQEFIQAKKEQPGTMGNTGQIDQLSVKYGILTQWNRDLFPSPALTPQQLEEMRRNLDSDKEFQILPSPGGTIMQVPPGSKGGTLILPGPKPDQPGPKVSLGPGTAVQLDGTGLTIQADGAKGSESRVVVDTGKSFGFSVRYGSVYAIPETTRYAVAVDSEGALRLNVLEGKVTLADADAGVSVVVPAGEQAQVRPDGLPQLVSSSANGSGERWWEAIPGSGATSTDPSWVWMAGGVFIVVAGFVMLRRRAGPKSQPVAVPAQAMGGQTATVYPAALAPSTSAPAPAIGAPPTLQPEAHHMERTTTCTSCGLELLPGAQFCAGCGVPATPPAPAAAFCYKCGTALAGDARFCAACGTQVPAPSRAQPAQAPGLAPAPLSAAAASGAASQAGGRPPARKKAGWHNGLFFLCALVSTLLTFGYPALLVVDLFLIIVLWRGGARKSSVFMALLFIGVMLVGEAVWNWV